MRLLVVAMILFAGCAQPMDLEQDGTTFTEPYGPTNQEPMPTQEGISSAFGGRQEVLEAPKHNSQCWAVESPKLGQRYDVDWSRQVVHITVGQATLNLSLPTFGNVSADAWRENARPPNASLETRNGSAWVNVPANSTFSSCVLAGAGANGYAEGYLSSNWSSQGPGIIVDAQANTTITLDYQVSSVLCGGGAQFNQTLPPGISRIGSAQFYCA